MDYVKLSFCATDEREIDDDNVDLLGLFLDVLYKNGQILAPHELIKCGKEYHAYVTLPETNSLEEKYNNKYVNDYLSQVKKLFHLKIEPIGENIDFEGSCSCKFPSWYMLYTDWMIRQSPVVCGDCGREVPLYKLPYLPERYEHIDILSWQSAYRSIDYIWRHCLSDRFSYRQMNDPKAQLAKEGRAICAELERLMDKPFYYYIFYNNKTKENCPNCSEKWEAVEGGFIDFRCAKCRLVADEVNENGIVMKAEILTEESKPIL